MEKSTDIISMDSSSRMEHHETAIKVAKIRTFGIFLTGVLISLVLVGGAIGGICLMRRSSDYGENDVACPTASSPIAMQGQNDNKLLDRDVTKDMEVHEENGRTSIRRVTYNLESNTAIIDIPGNETGVSVATLALDYDQDLVFISTYEDNMCQTFTLRENLATAAEEFLKSDTYQVIEELRDAATTEEYETLGEIPEGYLRSTNGPIVQGLCAGKPTYWLEYDAAGGELGLDRNKRGCYTAQRCCRVWFVRICWWVSVCLG